MIEIRTGYQYVRRLPVNFNSHDAFRFDPIRHCEINKAFITTIESAKICQFYIFSRGKLLEDFCIPNQFRGKQSVTKQWLKLQLFPKTKAEEAIWVIDKWSRNYFHWVLECLPRIIALRSAGFFAPLLIPEHLYKVPYIRDSLIDLNIETFTFNLRQTVFVKNLTVVSHDSPCAFDRDYLDSLVDTYQVIDAFDFNPATRKIYISRKDSLKRKVLNEDQLLPILLSEGFECIQMEQLTFKEQRKLMRETAVLISIHGAGLTNMLFIQEGGKVLELLPNVDQYNSCFYHLASARRLDYYYSFENGDHPNAQEANITVDLEKFSKTLKQI